MLKRFPSLSITVAAFVAAFVIGYAVYLMERTGYVDSEAFGWKVINKLGWWWWSVPAITSAFGLYYMARLDRPRTPLGWTSRIGALTGFIFYIGSWGNTVLGPVSAVLIPISFVLVIKQQADVCAAKSNRPSYSGLPWLIRFLGHLTTEEDEKVRG
jgi:hypothetical protein